MSKLFSSKIPVLTKRPNKCNANVNKSKGIHYSSKDKENKLDEEEEEKNEDKEKGTIDSALPKRQLNFQNYNRNKSRKPEIKTKNATKDKKEIAGKFKASKSVIKYQSKDQLTSIFKESNGAVNKKLEQNLKTEKMLKCKTHVNNTQYKDKKLEPREKKDEKIKTKVELKHIAQENKLEFKPNELFRQQILNQKELSPSSFKMQPGWKMSSASRPSIYRPMAISTNPYEDALKDLENMNRCSTKKNIKFEANELFRQQILSGRELSPSSGKKMQSGRKLSYAQRPSIYRPFAISTNPYKDALKDLENMNKCSKNPRPHHMDKLSLYSSPFKVKLTPQQQILKDLDTLKKRKLIKSRKKVTFKLDEEICSEQTKTGNVQSESSAEVTDTKEKGEINQHTLKEDENLFVLTEDLKALNIVPCSLEVTEKTKSLDKIRTAAESSSKEDCKFLNSPTKTNIVCSQSVEKYIMVLSKKKAPGSCFLNSVETANNIRTKQCIFDLAGSDKIIKPFTSVTNTETHQQFEKSAYNSLNSSTEFYLSNSSYNISDKKDDNFISVLPKFHDQCDIEEQIVTPCVYRYQSTASNSGSPEFFDDIKPKRLAICQTPIYTPLVLKGLAKNSESKKNAAPVRMKLNFVDCIDKKLAFCETPLKSCTLSTVSLQDIPTLKKKFDELADQECSAILCGLHKPVLCGRYMKNPIAIALDEGDEMHFLPVSPPQQANFV